MALVNFIVVPALMIFFVMIFDIEAPHSIGLVISSTAAAAPLLIKLTARSQNEIAAGATVQMVLMIATVFIMPLLIEGVSVHSWAIVSSLLLHMMLPMVIGMIVLTVAEPLTAVFQPWVARISNIALYAMLIATILSNLGALTDLYMWGAILTGIVGLLVAFGIGHNTGIGKETDSQIGALGTAQRTTAAAVLVTQTNFTDPLVLLTTVLLSTIMMFVRLFIATLMAKDIRLALLEPLEADPPQRNPSKKRRVLTVPQHQGHKSFAEITARMNTAAPLLERARCRRL